MLRLLTETYESYVLSVEVLNFNPPLNPFPRGEFEASARFIPMLYTK